MPHSAAAATTSLEVAAAVDSIALNATEESEAGGDSSTDFQVSKISPRLLLIVYHYKFYFKNSVKFSKLWGAKIKPKYS